MTRKLWRWRITAGLTQRECADLAGISEAMWCRMERGERNAAPRTKVAIARRLGARVSDLFDVEEIDEEEAHLATR